MPPDIPHDGGLAPTRKRKLRDLWLQDASEQFETRAVVAEARAAEVPDMTDLRRIRLREQRKLQGDTVMNNIVWQLDNFYDLSKSPPERIEREPMQIEYHKALLEMLIPSIYGDELDFNWEVIMDRYKTDDIFPYVQIFAGRRNGKSYAVAMICAAALLHMPKASIAGFAVALRAAEELINTTYDLLLGAPGVKDVRIRKNAQRILVTVSKHDSRVMTAFPGTTDVSRPLGPWFCLFVLAFLFLLWGGGRGLRSGVRRPPSCIY